MKEMKSRRNLIQVALGLASICAMCQGVLPAHAQTWPTKPVRVIVPAPAGSSLDVIVRAMSDALRTRWGQPLVIEKDRKSVV